MPPRKTRHPSPEELALWRKVTDAVTPMRTVPTENEPAESLKPRPARPVVAPKTPAAQKPVPARGPQMDAKAHKRLNRGQLDPEARIDLHGMTAAQAHSALHAFVLASHGVGRRLLLVITGKGKLRDDGGPIPPEAGLLKRQVPMWLREGSLAPYVLEVTESHRRHGGSGAYYVYLRRRR